MDIRHIGCLGVVVCEPRKQGYERIVTVPRVFFLEKKRERDLDQRYGNKQTASTCRIVLLRGFIHVPIYLH